MGRIKDYIIYQDENPLSSVPDKMVASHHFGNNLIQDYIQNNGIDGVCSYCGDHTTVCALRSVVEEIDRIIMMYYGDPDNEGVGWDSSFYKENVQGFHAAGNGYILPDKRTYYDDISILLLKNGFLVNNDELREDIVDALSYHIHLVEKDPYGLTEAEERWIDWEYIKESAKKMTMNGNSLDEMIKQEAARLNYLLNDIYSAKLPLQVETGLTLFRTVNYKTRRLPLLFRDLTSPPVEFTCDLRMSKKGDPVFYGAENRDTAVREALSDGSRYTYIGRFVTKHPLRLLDLTVLPDNFSIFDQEQFYLLTFLDNFTQAVSQDVPDHDGLLYAPTQLITYYFRYYLKHYYRDGTSSPIDGILYTSSKDGAMNAVLFFDNRNSYDHLKLTEWECIHEGNSIRKRFIHRMKWVEDILSKVRTLWMR